MQKVGHAVRHDGGGVAGLADELGRRVDNQLRGPAVPEPTNAGDPRVSHVQEVGERDVDWMRDGSFVSGRAAEVRAKQEAQMSKGRLV